MIERCEHCGQTFDAWNSGCLECIVFFLENGIYPTLTPKPKKRVKKVYRKAAR